MAHTAKQSQQCPGPNVRLVRRIQGPQLAIHASHIRVEGCRRTEKALCLGDIRADGRVLVGRGPLAAERPQPRPPGSVEPTSARDCARESVSWRKGRVSAQPAGFGERTDSRATDRERGRRSQALSLHTASQRAAQPRPTTPARPRASQPQPRHVAGVVRQRLPQPQQHPHHVCLPAPPAQELHIGCPRLHEIAHAGGGSRRVRREAARRPSSDAEGAGGLVGAHELGDDLRTEKNIHACAHSYHALTRAHRRTRSDVCGMLNRFIRSRIRSTKWQWPCAPDKRNHYAIARTRALQ